MASGDNPLPVPPPGTKSALVQLYKRACRQMQGRSVNWSCSGGEGDPSVCKQISFCLECLPLSPSFPGLWPLVQCLKLAPPSSYSIYFPAPTSEFSFGGSSAGGRRTSSAGTAGHRRSGSGSASASSTLRCSHVQKLQVRGLLHTYPCMLCFHPTCSMHALLPPYLLPTRVVNPLLSSPQRPPLRTS